MEIRDLLTFDAPDEAVLGAGNVCDATVPHAARGQNHDTPPLSARRSWGPPEPDDGPLPLEAAILAYLARHPPAGRAAAD